MPDERPRVRRRGAVVAVRVPKPDADGRAPPQVGQRGVQPHRPGVMDDDDVELLVEELRVGLVEIPPIALVLVAPTAAVAGERAPEFAVHRHVLRADAHLLPVDVEPEVGEERNGAAKHRPHGVGRGGGTRDAGRERRAAGRRRRAAPRPPSPRRRARTDLWSARSRPRRRTCRPPLLARLASSGTAPDHPAPAPIIRGERARGVNYAGPSFPRRRESSRRDSANPALSRWRERAAAGSPPRLRRLEQLPRQTAHARLPPALATRLDKDPAPGLRSADNAAQRDGAYDREMRRL